MQRLGSSLRNIFQSGIALKRNEQWTYLPAAAFSSSITPVKMSVNVVQTDKTDPNLPPLIIMHGLFGSKLNWKSMSKALEKRTRRKIYNVDARNHGDSPHHPEHGSAHMTADIIHLMNEEKINRVSVLGHSMGGRTMMYFALNYPHLVEKAIIADISPVSIPQNLEAMQSIFLAMKNINVSPDLSMAQGRVQVRNQIQDAVGDKQTVDFLMLNLKKKESGEFVWIANVDGLLNNFRDFTNTQQYETKPFTGPMLFIAGKRSPYVRPDDWPKIKERFPNAQIEWLDTGHLVHFEEPEKFIQLVDDFLKK